MQNNARKGQIVKRKLLTKEKERERRGKKYFLQKAHKVHKFHTQNKSTTKAHFSRRSAKFRKPTREHISYKVSWNIGGK